MGMLWPALDVRDLDAAFLLAAVDDFSPTALVENESALTLFFASANAREAARAHLQRTHPHARTTSREIDDEDWARRSQENLQPITVGRLTIYPDPDARAAARGGGAADSGTGVTAHSGIAGNLDSGTDVATDAGIDVKADSASTPLALTIRPSMGFGTGHHATTRLCLSALQQLDLSGASVLDAGTGSGILSLAARLLGARVAVGIDSDPDAIQAADDNLQLNPSLSGVRFEVADLTAVLAGPRRLEPADVVVANLTGAALVRSASLLSGAARTGGHLIVSGLLQTEEMDVRSAFAPWSDVVWSAREDEWSGLMLKKR